MEDSSRHIDYQQAAERLLVALSCHAERCVARGIKNLPIPAVRLCPMMFDAKVRIRWKGGRESWRRRVRQAAVVARKLLMQQAGDGASPGNSNPQLIGDGAGYMLDADPRVIAWYAGQRRRAGLTHLAAASQTKRTLAHAGQQSLFSGADALVGRERTQ